MVEIAGHDFVVALQSLSSMKAIAFLVIPVAVRDITRLALRFLDRLYQDVTEVILNDLDDMGPLTHLSPSRDRERGGERGALFLVESGSPRPGREDVPPRRGGQRGR